MNIIFCLLAIFAADPAFAGDSVVKSIRNSAIDAKTGAKKTARRIKREFRNATGQSSVVEDMKDSFNDAKDEVDGAIEKGKN